jgi:hypothetical protein
LCVEVRLTGSSAGVRDSKNRNGSVFAFSPATWTRFVADARSGTFDHPGTTGR